MRREHLVGDVGLEVRAEGTERQLELVDRDEQVDHRAGRDGADQGRHRPDHAAEHDGDRGADGQRLLAAGEDDVCGRLGLRLHEGDGRDLGVVSAVDVLDQLVELGAVGQELAERRAERLLDVRGVVSVQGTGDGEQHELVGGRDRDRLESVRQRLGQPAGDLEVGHEVGQADALHLVHLGQGRDEDVLGDRLVGDQDVAERVSGAGVLEHRGLELLVGDQPAVGEHPGHLHPGPTLVGGLDLALGRRVDRVDRGGDLVGGVPDQLDRAVDALLDHLQGDRVVDVGHGHEHDAVGDGVRHHPEGAADALGQQPTELGADPVGEPDACGGDGGGHEAPAPNPVAEAWGVLPTAAGAWVREPRERATR